MTSPEQMEFDAARIYKHLKRNPKRVYISNDGLTLYALVKGAIVCIQDPNGANFKKMSKIDIYKKLHVAFPNTF